MTTVLESSVLGCYITPDWCHIRFSSCEQISPTLNKCWYWLIITEVILYTCNCTFLGFITALLRGGTCDLVAAVFRTWSPLTEYCRDQDGSMLWVLWQLLTSVSKSHLSSWMCFNQFSYLPLGKIVTLQHIFHPYKQNIHVSVNVNSFTEVNWGSSQKRSEVFTVIMS